MTIAPYIFFNGDCRAALAFYGAIFGTTPEIMSAAGMPDDFPVPEDRKDWVMHGMLKVGQGTLMASDNLFGESADMQGCAVQLSFDTANEARAIFDRLAEGGEITMPWAPTFWSAGFGTLTDRFGTHWMVGCEEPPAA